MFSKGDPTTPGHYGPSKTALLLLDFHTKFVEQVGMAPAALETAVKLREWAISQGILVVHGLIDIHDHPFATCKDYNRLEGIVASMRSEGGDEAQGLLEGSVEDEVTFTRKPGHVSALQSPGMITLLRRKCITSLILTGLSTSGCVMRTAVAAADAEFVVTVIADGCADPASGAHDAMVHHILNNRGYVTTASEFMRGFESVFCEK